MPANGAPRPSATDCGWIVTISSRVERQRHGIGPLRLHADHADRTVARALTAAATPEISPPPPTPTTSTSTIGQVLEELEARRTVAGDHRRIVERVDEREALGVADPLHLGERLADVLAVQDDPGAVAQAGVDLRPHGARRHDDRDRHARGATGPGIGLPGIPRRQRDGAALARLGRRASRSGSSSRGP